MTPTGPSFKSEGSVVYTMGDDGVVRALGKRQRCCLGHG